VEVVVAPMSYQAQPAVVVAEVLDGALNLVVLAL
jgi:hypothetical protein